MLGRLIPVIFVIVLLSGLFALAVMPACADEVYTLDKDFKRANSDIVIHLIDVNVTDRYMGNIYPSRGIENTQWAHPFHRYENTGDKAETGSIQFELIDTNGTKYRFNPNLDEYAGEMVQPHSTSELRFIEIPVPRGTVLARIHVFEGTNPTFLLADETYGLTPASGISPSATPGLPFIGGSASTRTTCCGPLLPFAIVASLGITGLYIKGKGIKKWVIHKIRPNYFSYE